MNNNVEKDLFCIKTKNISRQREVFCESHDLNNNLWDLTEKVIFGFMYANCTFMQNILDLKQYKIQWLLKIYIFHT